MHRSELIKTIAKKTYATQNEVLTILNAIEEVILECAGTGELFELKGILRITTSDRAARTGYNPQTGKPLLIPAKTVPTLRAGSRLKLAAAEVLLRNTSSSTKP